jgi:hypothetical protein
MAEVQIGQVADLVKSERTRNRYLRVIVRADKGCSYGTMEDVMNALQSVQANRFVLMTEGEGAESATKDLPGDQGALGGGTVDEVAAVTGARDGEIAWAR